MPQVRVEVRHKLTQAAAIVRVTHMIETLKAEHRDKLGDLQENWRHGLSEFSFTALNMNFAGTCLVTPKSAEVKLEIPWLALPMKGQIESTIREKLETTLS